MESKRLKIKTITPVCVTTGDVLSPVSDFFIKDQKVNFINQKKLEEALLYKNLMGRYVKSIQDKTYDQKKSNFSIYSFINNELGSPEDYVKYSLSYPNHFSRKQGELYTHVKTNEYPYIPGSSMKGAIKTALFYNCLQKTKEGKESLKKIIHKIHELEEEIETIYNKNRDDKNTKRLRKDFENFLNREINKKLDVNEKSLFSQLSISDTDPFEKESVVIFNVNRVHLKKKRSIPQIKECINKNYNSALDIKLNINLNYDEFVKNMNRFAYNAIVTEQEILENYSEGMETKIRINLNAFYDKSLDEIDRIENEGKSEIYLRIGSGKSYYDNTVGMAIFEQDEQAFDTFCKLYQLGKAPKENNFILKEPFPITRSVVNNNFEPMGWVKITLNN